jgi:TonB family protein
MRNFLATTMARLKPAVLCLMLLTGSLVAADKPERKLVQRDEPEYPEIAKRNNLHGAVKLRIWIEPDGKVRRVEYIGGHPVLAESALRSVKTWTYGPADRESTEVITIRF